MKISKKKKSLRKMVFKLLKTRVKTVQTTIKKKQEKSKHLFSLWDLGLFNKKVGINNKNNFRNTIKNYNPATKLVDILSITASIPIIVPIISELFLENNNHKSPTLSDNLVSDGWDYK